MEGGGSQITKQYNLIRLVTRKVKTSLVRGVCFEERKERRKEERKETPSRMRTYLGSFHSDRWSDPRWWQDGPVCPELAVALSMAAEQTHFHRAAPAFTCIISLRVADPKGTKVRSDGGDLEVVPGRRGFIPSSRRLAPSLFSVVPPTPVLLTPKSGQSSPGASHVQRPALLCSTLSRKIKSYINLTI